MILIVVLSLILSIDVGVYLSDPSTTWRGVLFGLAATLATSLFAWRPAAAGTGLLLVALVQLAAGQDGSDFLFVTGAAGLVVYTSPRWFTATYIAATAALTILATASLEVFTATALPAFALLVAVSASIGWALRAARGRENRLARDLADLSRERTAAIAHERERIADELHDIIAHDVTLIAMHARVLERVDDPTLHAESIRAIRDSSDQALSDIRRMLHIVRDGETTPTETSREQRADVRSTLDDAVEALSQLGAFISAHLESVAVSAAIEQTLIHVIREATTNIAKHAPEHPNVSISLRATDEGVSLEMKNSAPNDARSSELPSSGYGLDRLRERVALLGGELTAERTDETWTLTVRLPDR